jgi:hypothetical protein
MKEPLVRVAGLAVVALYASVLVWLYAEQPRSMAEVAGGLSATVGAYQIDALAFEDGLQYFRSDQFAAARAAFRRADPAERDPRTQFYIAYSYYRQGWHRTHHEDALYRDGLEIITRAIRLAPDGRLIVDDPELGMHRGDELKAELEAGLTTDASDFDPRRLLQRRK